MKEIVNNPEKEIVKQKYSVTSTTCDVCKKKIENDSYDYSDTTIAFKIGMIYPEGDFRTVYYLDICQDCFKEKLLEVLPFKEVDEDNVRYGNEDYLRVNNN